jgi:hypothetical protein
MENELGTVINRIKKFKPEPDVAEWQKTGEETYNNIIKSVEGGESLGDVIRKLDHESVDEYYSTTGDMDGRGGEYSATSWFKKYYAVQLVSEFGNRNDMDTYMYLKFAAAELAAQKENVPAWTKKYLDSIIKM